eukprot:12930282-Prorocentrum_lima.AAC.1
MWPSPSGEHGLMAFSIHELHPGRLHVPRHAPHIDDRSAVSITTVRIVAVDSTAQTCSIHLESTCSTEKNKRFPLGRYHS